jgi:hypothetical protein
LLSTSRHQLRLLGGLAMSVEANAFGCSFSIGDPRKAGSSLQADFVITCDSNRSIVYEALIKHHRRAWPDETIGSEEGIEVMTPGQPFRGTVTGACKGGKRDYFSKISIRPRELSGAKKKQNDRVEISC